MQYDVYGGVAVITIDNPPVNALRPGVLEAIDEAVDRGVADPGVGALVLVGAGATFVAGADINLFKTLTTREEALAFTRLLHAQLRHIEDALKPVVAAIHGAALGGGLELAMACHFRVATGDAHVGQPEVLLGLIPGAGGTQRLPRLCGTAMALEMCTEGRPVSASDALAAGIVDRMVTGGREALIDAAVAFARERAKAGAIRRTRDLTDKVADVDAAIRACDERRAAFEPLAQSQAPLAAIHAIEAACMLSFDAASALEQELFANCVLSDASRALVYVFFAEREAAKSARRSPTLGVVGPGADLIRDRMQACYVRAAHRLLDDGVLANQIDRALARFGMGAGPFSFREIPGVHVGAEVRQERAPRSTVRPTGVGKRSAVSDEEIVEFVTAALANEGTRLLEEGHASRPGDIDVICCYSFGFPRARGGPMYYADAVRHRLA